MPTNVLPTHTGFLALCVGSLSLVILAIECRRLARRATKAEARAADLAREAGVLNDDLLQSIQGLILTVYMATQRMPSDPHAKRVIEQAFTSADKAVLKGVGRFEELELRPTGKGPEE